MTNEEINCPCCGRMFNCTPCNISNCQCNNISLTVEQRQQLSEQFSECICRSCLLEFKANSLFTNKASHENMIARAKLNR